MRDIFWEDAVAVRKGHERAAELPEPLFLGSPVKNEEPIDYSDTIPAPASRKSYVYVCALVYNNER